MKTLSIILVGFVAVLHIYILVLEMFLWTKPRGLKAFGQTLEKANASATLAANQGLYNGFLAAGLLWGLFYPSVGVSKHIQVFFLLCVTLAGLYGAYSVNRKIFFIQSVPALLALGSLWIF